VNRFAAFTVLVFLMTLSMTPITGCSSAPKLQGATPAAPAPLPTTVDEAVASTYRTEANRARDQYRHPRETLEFFGVKHDMTIIEISPGAGWYLEILAPLLTFQGHYIAAMPLAGATGDANSGTAKILDWEKAHPEIASKITTVEFSPPEKTEVAPAESADMVLTFRNVHNWMMKGAEKAAFEGFFKALKPGGVLGVVEHRAKANEHDPKAKSGYVREKDVIALAKSVGFKYDTSSELNANAKDTKDHPEGVWTLPPTLRLKEKDREKYLAIGESDRMTLRFIKPMAAKKSSKKKKH
jgi:predicted methyltransferase